MSNLPLPYNKQPTFCHFAQKGVLIVAVYIDDEVEACQKAQYPSSWLSVYAPEIDRQDLYDIKALPTLYLLDVQKRVVVKDGRLKRIEQIVL